MGCASSKPRASSPTPASIPPPQDPIPTAKKAPTPQENPQEGQGLRKNPSVDPMRNKASENPVGSKASESSVGNKASEGPAEQKASEGPVRTKASEGQKNAVTDKKSEATLKHAPVPLVIDLHACYLSGKWYILRNAVSEEINPELNRLIEEGFHTGLGVFTFSYASGEYSMDYAQGEITFVKPEGNKLFSIARKIGDFAELLWTGEDGLQRPFPAEVEALILSHPTETVQFHMNSRLFQASLSSLSLLDTTTSLSFPLQRL